MKAAITLVVVLDDVFDANEALFARLYLFQNLPKLAVGLAAAVLDLLVVVLVAWDQVDDNLIRDEVFPVCAGDRRAGAEQEFGGAEVVLALYQQVLDLGMVSAMRNTVGEVELPSDV